MNNVQRFKVADAIGQVLIAPVLYVLLRSADHFDASVDGWELAGCYLFGVGAWQATSCLVWAFVGATRAGIGRKIYSWLLLVLCVLALTLLAGNSRMNAGSDSGILFLFALIVLGPIMSAWYFLLTIIESSSLGEKNSRP